MATSHSKRGQRVAAIGAVAAVGAALFSSLAVSGASMAATSTTQDVTYVASAVNTSKFGAQGGSFAVTYTPATTLDAACGVTPQPFTVNYSLTAPQATSAWSAASSMAFTTATKSVNHTTGGVKGLAVTFGVTQNGTLKDNKGWNAAVYPIQGGTRSPFTEFTPDGTYVRPTATTPGQFVPTSSYSITAGAVPATDAGGVALKNSTWDLTWSDWVHGVWPNYQAFGTPVNAIDGVKTFQGDGVDAGLNRAGGTTVEVLGAMSTSTQYGTTLALADKSMTETIVFDDVMGTATCAEVVDTPVVDGGVAAAAAGVVGIAGLGGVMISRRRKAAESL